jgi:hypothetical protein
MDAGDVVVGGEEDQRRRDSGTATFLYERAAKARAAVIAGAGAKLAHAKPNPAESTSRVAKAHNQTRCCCVAPRDFLSQLPAHNTATLLLSISISTPLIHHDTSINRLHHFQLIQPTHQNQPPTHIHQNDWRQVWRKGLWHQVQRAIVSPPHPSLRSSLFHHL